MRVKVVSYVSRTVGISVKILPDTEQEEALLEGVWRHGKLEIAHPGDDELKAGRAFSVRWGGEWKEDKKS